MKKSIILLALIGVLGTGLAWHNTRTEYIELYVDYGPLGGGTSIQYIPATGDMTAYEVLSSVGLTTQGTVEYGDAVICRLNGVPDITQESCESMPPAEAYWAVLIKEHEIVPMPLNLTGEWGWAQTGADEIILSPGDSLGLVFADNGEVKLP